MDCLEGVYRVPVAVASEGESYPMCYKVEPDRVVVDNYDR